jgi:hypothetical protein
MVSETIEDMVAAGNSERLALAAMVVALNLSGYSFDAAHMRLNRYVHQYRKSAFGRKRHLDHIRDSDAAQKRLKHILRKLVGQKTT